MSKFRFAVTALAAISLLAIAGLSSTFAAHPAMMKNDRITVKITTTNGTTWGKVSADWKVKGKEMMGKVCKKAECTYSIPHMTKITLIEKPTNAATWPFKDWSVAGSSHGHMMTMMSKKITFEAMGHTATAKAVYVVK